MALFRRSLPALLVLAGLNTASASPRVKAAPEPAKAIKVGVTKISQARQVVRFRQSLRQKFATSTKEWSGASLFHQVKEEAHRALWAAELGAAKTPTQRAEIFGRWVGAGRYPGLWTLAEEGWYGAGGGTPFKIRLKQGVRLFDPDNAEHQAIYKTWKEEHPLGPHGVANAFENILDPGGTPLARKTGYIKAPQESQFYRDLKIAGVAHYDVYGRECIVLFNPSAVADARLGE